MSGLSLTDFNVLPGDADQSGQVDAGDIGPVGQNFLQTTTGPFQMFADLDATGQIDAGDIGPTGSNFLSTLPNGNLPSNLTAAAGQVTVDSVIETVNVTFALTVADVQPVFEAARDLLLNQTISASAHASSPLFPASSSRRRRGPTKQTNSLLSSAQREALLSTSFVITDMGNGILGQAVSREDNHVIRLDLDAAGHGWFVDASPRDDEEFYRVSNGLQAEPESPAEDRMDLLSVVLHELGHVIGLEHDDDPSSLMFEELAAGRRNRSLDTVFASRDFASGIDPHAI